MEAERGKSEDHRRDDEHRKDGEHRPPEVPPKEPPGQVIRPKRPHGGL